MIRYLIHRPIAVCIVTIVLVLLGGGAFKQLPVSLLPDIPIPEITVQANYPSASARELQRIIEQPLRNQLVQVAHLQDINSITQDGLSVINLRFDYGTNIQLAYLETNEKIDAIMDQLPSDLERPKVIKAGASDIPVFTLNVLPKSDYKEDFLALSEFSENVLKRRIEQLSEVALVDITGQVQPQAVISINSEKIAGLGIDEQQIIDAVKRANIQPGNFSVREGEYQYNIRFSSILRTIDDIGNITLSVGGSIVPNGAAQNDPRVTYFADNVLTTQMGHLNMPRRSLLLRDISEIKLDEKPSQGLYTFNGKRGLALSIIKQTDAQLLQLKPKLSNLLAELNKDYPQLHFELSQDQTELLNISINNLISNLLAGSILSFGLIFLFIRDWRIPLLIGLVIPISVTITFLAFYVLGLSINIVSLAGLVLGMGEIVDSAIIIIESVEEKREGGRSVEVSCEEGANEVIRPLFTSVLTNSAVFLPLILLSGIAGALFYDQAVAASLSLSISLLCSYTLIPVFYFLIYSNYSKQHFVSPTLLTRWLESVYDVVFYRAFRYKYVLIITLILLLLCSIWVVNRIKKEGMPDLSRTEMEIRIDWNEPITIAENQRRTKRITALLQKEITYISAFIGQQQFLLNRQLQQKENEVLLSIKTESKNSYNQLAQMVVTQLSQQYPHAIIALQPARNVFEQVFNITEPLLRLHIYSTKSKEPPSTAITTHIGEILKKNNFLSKSIKQQPQLIIQILFDKLLLYEVSEDAVIQSLKTIFKNSNISNLQGGQGLIPVVLARPDTQTDWRNTFIYNRRNQAIPLRSLITVNLSTDYSNIYTNQEGPFVPFDFDTDTLPANMLQKKVELLLKDEPDITWDWSGRYFRDRIYLNELIGIVAVAILLLFCILVAQFESIQQPLIILIIILLGLTGALCALYFYGNSLNILSAIGMVVLIGLLDNDSILKIDTMNRGTTSLSLIDSIHLAGRRRLKSQVMTFLTTVLGLLPVLFSGGLGSELQQPLAISVIGGMCVGVLASWTVIPILYWWLARKERM